MINILDAQDSIEKRLIKTIRFNARVIQTTEARNSADAVYWAIRRLLDSLRKQHATDGCRTLMQMVKTRYPEHLQNLLRYSLWTGSPDERDNVLAGYKPQENAISSRVAAGTALPDTGIKAKKTF